VISIAKQLQARSAPQSSEVPAGAMRRLENLKGVILLEGSVHGSELANAVGRSILELPVIDGLSVLDLWRQEIADLACLVGVGPLPCRLLLGHGSRPPVLSPRDVEAGITVERDCSEFRGTGGALRDQLADEDDSAEYLVAGAAQVLFEPLHLLATQIAAKGGEVSLVTYDDGSPSNISLIRQGAMKNLPAAGFVDLKEKGLAIMAATHNVTVLRRPRATSAPLRSLQEYIAALRGYHRAVCGHNTRHAPFEERWSSTFSIVEPGAVIEPGARLHDSVVLSGGRIGAGSLLVRSLVARTGSIPPGRRVTGAIVNTSL